MLTLRKSDDRSPTKLGWLDSRHSYAFGGYCDPAHMGFGNSLVTNEDPVTPGAGFGRHGHSDMEIIFYVLEGALGHKDSTATDGIIRPGEIQRMSAGTGIELSEINASRDEPVHFAQIRVKPANRGIAPGYEQVAMPPVQADAQIDPIAGPEGGSGAVMLHADAYVYRIGLAPGASLEVPLVPGRRGRVQVARGSVSVHGQLLETGDGLAVDDEPYLAFVGGEHAAEILFFGLN